MLEKIYIKNYILIKELTISFRSHFNVITGETGAGKSIILGALSLILGERADTQVLIDATEKCIIEGHFNIAGHVGCKAILKANDLDVEDQTIIRREISPQGKSRAFINDTPVTLSLLNEFTSQLVDLHRQFDNLSVRENNFSFQIIDALANNQELLQQYQSELKKYQGLQKKYNDLLQNKHQLQQELDFKQYLLQELESFDAKPNEIEQLEDQVKALQYADDIKQGVLGVQYGLVEDEMAINHQLKKMVQSLQQVAKLHSPVESLAQRLESVWIELKDIANELTNVLDSVEENPELLQTTSERLDLGYKLLKKHNVLDTEHLIQLQLQLAREVGSVLNLDEELMHLEQNIAAKNETLQQMADLLSEQRKATTPTFGAKVNDYIHLMGMPNAHFDVQIVDVDNFDIYGKNNITFVIDTNKSGKYAPIQKSASGGELSRIMLAIKTITAQAIALPTMIFDEVDTGISGEAAKQVGNLMKELGTLHQIICITHQPQVAAKAESHYYVYKRNEGDGVTTSIRLLEENERVEAIAQMIGGETLSEAALNNAKELMQ
jgi:DNA repair protein RecN (Recombination protein N)